ncbi:MAG: hypothetical protein II077_03505 [Treponema sp.]|nr:hypothetical protein [Treponema sp.]
MIEWLRDKFSTAINIFFVLYVAFATIFGGIVGYITGKGMGGYYHDYGVIGCFLGLIAGLMIGIVVGILAFGFFATIIHISESCDTMIRKLDSLNYYQKDFAQNVTSAVAGNKGSSGNNSSDVWVCPKCGETNPAGTMLCGKCGQ